MFGGEKCESCNKNVYLLDKATVNGKHWHKSCFKCNHCNKVLPLGQHIFAKGMYIYFFY